MTDKCASCNCILINGLETDLCKKCINSKLIFGNDAIQQYKLTKKDIDNYFNDISSNHRIYHDKNRKKYLISDIEKIMLKKYTGLDGILLLKNINKSIDIDNNIQHIYDSFPTETDEINTMKKQLLTDKKMSVDDIINQIIKKYTHIQTVKLAIDKCIKNALCSESALLNICGLSLNEYDRLKKCRCDIKIFSDLQDTFKYKIFIKNFNFDIFDEITILKINFVEIFINDIKSIVFDIMKNIKCIEENLLFEKREMIIKENIANTLCKEKVLIDECNLTHDDYKKLMAYYGEIEILNELTQTVTYYRLVKNDVSSEKQLLGINFTKLFIDDLKIIISRFMNVIDRMHNNESKKFQIFNSIVDRFIGANKIHEQYFSKYILEFNKIKIDYFSYRILDSTVLHLIENIVKKIQNGTVKI